MYFTVNTSLIYIFAGELSGDSDLTIISHWGDFGLCLRPSLRHWYGVMSKQKLILFPRNRKEGIGMPGLLAGMLRVPRQTVS